VVVEEYYSLKKRKLTVFVEIASEVKENGWVRS